MTADDIKDMTNQELEKLIEELQDELYKRERIASIPEAIVGMIQEFRDAGGEFSELQEAMIKSRDMFKK